MAGIVVFFLILGILSYPEHLLPPYCGGARCLVTGAVGTFKATKRRACLFRGLFLALRLVRMINRAEAGNHDRQTNLSVSSVVTKM